ncbi:ABC transporter ATP-binding protein [Pseudothermotoga thermarum]|uniref:Oligopeptide/dipeptide ABC transporter, ATPase subunit n=1 Tax=Pseudothermotoga thermarum DSM 5069 TaxID=688269 RepID=F7YW61_9THEM|nr:ABC transporter ATP-binding protein [Pseudothermotoga thermarum]AEH51833.1 oligopeptide/dipeptide ABC transporter, ATPase subunit [Pseudothermotoga thermarum DSM 5069]
MPSILEVKGLKKTFTIRKGFKTFKVKVLRGVDLTLSEREIVSIVGESGSGKTTLLRVIGRLYSEDEGEIVLFGSSLPKKFKRKEELDFRRKVQIVFQDPFSSLNPVKKVKYILERPLKIYGIKEEREILRRIEEALQDVELLPPELFLNKYPHELSGGQRQRVAFARSIITRPKIILADEPTSMLDVSIKSSILNLILKLREEHGIAFIHVTHDLASARYISDKIMVMYAGMVLEEGDAKELVSNPLHPYTQLLLKAFPDPKSPRSKIGNLGEPPSLIEPPPGCPFEPRCKYRQERCKNYVELKKFSNRLIRCILYE